MEITAAAYAPKAKTGSVSDNRLAEMRAEIQAQYLGGGGTTNGNATSDNTTDEDHTDYEQGEHALTLSGEVCRITM